MTAYEAKITISREEAETIRGYLENEPKDRSECLGEEETIRHTAVFADGRQMDIKCCGVRYIEGESNKAWSEAVLFDEDGAELACTDPDGYYTGKWEIQAGGAVYRVSVEIEKE